MPYPEKQTYNKILRAIQAWEAHRPKRTFAGMSLADFKAKVKPSLDARGNIDSLRTQLKGVIRERREADTTSVDACSKLVNAVRGDFNEGDDSPFYKALGYTPKSERRSGLHRVSTTVPTIRKAA